MITKFEKRVLALLMAGLLCVPVIASSPVTVNAEEAENTVQQDEQRNAESDVQNSAADVQTDAGGQQSVPENQEKKLSGEEAGNDLVDGAFVPIEEEQENGQNNEERDENIAPRTPSEGLQGEEQKKAVVQKAAANSLSGEEPEEVTLGENGEPVRMTTEIAESEAAVRYLFQPQESGAYYIDLLGTGNFSVYEMTEDGYEQWVASDTHYEYEYGSAVFELEAGTTYYIDISYDYYGTAGTVNWKLGCVQDITPGEYEAVISEPGERAHYHLIYGESDIYYFDIDETTGAYFILDFEDSSSMFSFSSYEKVNKNNECYIDVFFYDDMNATGNVRWGVTEVDVQTAVEGQTIHVSPEETNKEVIYKFVPQTSGKYKIVCDSVSVYDESWSWIGNNMVELEAEKTYYFLLSFWSGEYTWSVNKATEIEIQENEKVHTEAGSYNYYKFVPAMNGYYTVSGDNAELYDSEWNRLYIFEDTWPLSAGETYYIVMSSDRNTGWSITRREEILIQADEIIYTERGESVYYKFTPTESGRYSISSYYAVLYDANWDSLSENKWELLAGETYYILIDSNRDVEWSINLSEEIVVQEGEIINTEEGKGVYYKFIPTESGRYSISSIYATLYDSEWNIIYNNIYNIYRFEAGTTYYILINAYSDTEWSISKMEETEITAGNPYRAYAGKGVYFKFIPTESDYYSIDYRLDMYDSDWNEIWDDNLIKDETYYLVPGSYYEDFYFMVEKGEEESIDKIEIQEDTVYVTDEESSVQYYTFIPKETGRYYFESEENATIYISYENETSRSYGFNYWITLKAGEEYDIEISIPYYDVMTDIHWSVKKAALSEITADEKYTTESGSTQEYVFVPDATGYYMLESEDLGSCIIYDENWNPVETDSDNYDNEILDGYVYTEETGFGACIYLEAGKSYYIDIIPSEAEAVWEINPIKQSGDYWYRTLSDGTVEILRYSGEDSSLYIPETIEGQNVESIGYGAFRENVNLTDVIIPNKVTRLQYGAFLKCSNLKNVTMEEGSALQSIEPMAFYECTTLESIDLPDSIQKIGARAFYYDSSLTEVILPDNLSILGEYAFGRCSSLETVVLGKGLEGIEAGVFTNCENLAAIEFPENITYIGDYAFESTGVSKVEIPDTITSIGNGAFSGCDFLQEVNIGSSVAYIADRAFSGCDLRNVMINSEISSIGQYAFSGNSNLESIDIPNSVTEIEYRAFQDCGNLLDIEIPDSVETIGGYAFGTEKNNGENTAWYDNQNDGVVYAGKVLYKYKGEIPGKSVISVEDGTKGIAVSAFEFQEGLTEIQFPDTLTNIGDYAVYGCESMTEIHIPQSVTEIGEYALGYLDARSNLKVTGFTIYGYAGSAAQTYASENGFIFVEVEPEYTLGDVDASGAVDIADLRVVLRSVCGKATLTADQKLAADVEKDDAVNIQDLRKILRFVCRKIDSLA